MTGGILCAGRLYCDVVFTGTPRLPTLGTEVFAEGVSLHAGGGAFITGATLVALGNGAAQFSVLPAAPFDAVVLQALAENGLSSKLCDVAPGGSDPQITVAIPYANDRAFLTRAAGDALPSLAALDWSSFSHLHIGELSTLEENPKLIERARSAGLSISLDCGWQDAFRPEVRDLIAAVDVFLPNQRELAALRDVGVPEACAEVTVVKHGKKGARARMRSHSDWHHEVSEAVRVIDATGAGDAFNGGFLSAWLKGVQLQDCLRQGNACGAASVQCAGGVGGLASLPQFDTAAPSLH
ncbi:MAG: carbohydrate kinase family protein [Boseongicola sp.]|nr:carbohydrate kinase family protein [Boseongicola sp.]